MDASITLVLSALLGWLLGLLTPQIVDTVRRKYERARIAGALSSELGALAQRLGCDAYHYWCSRGQLTLERVRWLASILESESCYPQYRRIAKGLQKLVELGPSAFETTNPRLAEEHLKGRKTVGLQRIEAPYLTSVLPRLDVFPHGTRQALLAIYSQIGFFNALVGECREYWRLTFDASIVGPDREAVANNLKGAESVLGQRAEYISRLIGSLDLDTEVVIPVGPIDDLAETGVQ